MQWEIFRKNIRFESIVYYHSFFVLDSMFPSSGPANEDNVKLWHSWIAYDICQMNNHWIFVSRAKSFELLLLFWIIICNAKILELFRTGMRIVHWGSVPTANYNFHISNAYKTITMAWQCIRCWAKCKVRKSHNNRFFIRIHQHQHRRC